MNTLDDLQFGRKMRQRRLAMAMSEELAASALGISTQRYRLLEAGSAHVDAAMLRDASLALRAQAAELVATLQRGS